MTTCTGNGASIVFGVSGWVGRVRSIGEFNQTHEVFDDTALDEQGTMKKCAGELADNSQFEVEFFFDPNDLPPLGGAGELVTVNHPVQAGQTNPPTHSGFAWVVSRTVPSYTNNDRPIGVMSIQFRGGYNGTASEPVFASGS